MLVILTALSNVTHVQLFHVRGGSRKWTLARYTVALCTSFDQPGACISTPVDMDPSPTNVNLSHTSNTSCFPLKQFVRMLQPINIEHSAHASYSITSTTCNPCVHQCIVGRHRLFTSQGPLTMRTISQKHATSRSTLQI